LAWRRRRKIAICFAFPEAAERFLNLLGGTKFAGESPHYRGHLSPPLDARWLRGGWTSHFEWKPRDDFLPAHWTGTGDRVPNSSHAV
jgi:hypothetical protein